jgi:hypothetical protein
MQNFLRVWMWVTLAGLATHSLSAAVVAPTVSSSSITNNTTGSQFTLSIVTNQVATGYYVASTVDATPTAAEIRNGQLSGGSAATLKGSFGTTASGSSNKIVTGLTRNRTYYVYFIVENSGGEQSAVGRVSALTSDVTPPSFNSSAITNITETQFNLQVNLNEGGDVYYVVTTSAVQPSATQVWAGQDASGNPAFKASFFSVTSTNTNTGLPIMGLNSGVQYYVYFVAIDEAENVSAVAQQSATTGGGTPPMFTTSSIIGVTSTQFNLFVNVNKDATVYYVVTTSNVAPSASQVINGTDQNNNAAIKSGSFNVVAGLNATSPPITGLTPNTTYYLYTVARDGANTNSPVITLNAATSCTPGNVTAVTLRDGATNAVLTWANPSCLDDVLVVGRLGSAVTAVPSGDGSSYFASGTFGSGSAIAPGQFAVYQGSGTTQTITSLTPTETYHFTVFTRKGTTWSAGTSASVVVGRPEVVSFSPADNSTNVPTTQVFTITFNEPVFISTNGGGGTGITFDGPATDLTINRNSAGGNGTINISGNVATLTLSTELDIAAAYNVLVGNRVFSDQYGNDYAGTAAADWNFTTATTVTAINAPTAAVCIDQYTALGDIALGEGANNNFQGTDNGTLTLALEFNETGFSFSPGTTGVTASVAPGGDIESVTVTSVSATQALFSLKFKDVANNAAARDNHDAITLSGLKVSRTSASVPPASIVLAASSTLPMQGVTPGTTVLANITAGSIPATPAVAWPGNKSSYCQGTDLSAITVTASGGTLYRWYSDAALTTLIASATSQTAAQLFGATPAVGASKRYVTNVNGCQSTAKEVTLTILAAPVADAGAAQAVCPQASVTLGGEPTASGGAGSYTYAWTGTGGFSSAVANPAIQAPVNTTNANIIQVYTVVVKDGNQCQASDEVTITTKELSQAVSITTPTRFTFGATNAAVTLQGSPANGTFSGTGVVQTAGTYKFDPVVATLGEWPVTYTATLTNGCVKSTVQNFTVTDVVTGNEPSLAEQIVLHPNPVNTQLSIEVPVSTPGVVTLRLIDSFGRETVLTEVKRGQRSATVDTHALAAGVYIVRIETSNGAAYHRMVIAHE